jgi:hypothetical protein
MPGLGYTPATAAAASKRRGGIPATTPSSSQRTDFAGMGAKALKVRHTTSCYQ